MPPEITLAEVDGHWLVLQNREILNEYPTLLLAASRANRLCGTLGGVAQLSQLPAAEVQAKFAEWIRRRPLLSCWGNR